MSATKPIIPTLTEIRERMLADVAYYLPGSGNRPYKSVLTVLVTVVAAAVWSLYLFADWILRQIDPLTASEAWLVIWGARLGVPRKPATVASGTVTFSGSGEIPAGTLVQSSDQRRYSTIAAVPAGQAVGIAALVAGYASNIPVTTTLSLVNPVAGIALEASATAITGGLDAESLPDWAQRIAARLAQMQQIGDADDYTQWAKQSHTAIVDAWVYGNTPHLGDITIYCLLASGVDPALVLPEASTALDRIRNVGCNLILRTPDVLPVTVRIAGISGDGTGMAVRELITADIQSLIVAKRSRNAYLYPEEIERIIVSRYGGTDYVLLAPVRRIAATGDQIMSLAEVIYE
jgi:uncharacterized phage protein gp47/JayE